MTKSFICLLKRKFAPDNASGMDREYIGNGSARSRKLFAVLILLLTVGVGNAWGDTGAITVHRTMILPAGSTAAYSSSDWTGAGAPSYGSGTANEIDDITISGSKVGSVKFVGSGGSGWLQLKSGSGYIETVISSTEGVDVEVYMKSLGVSGTITAALTGASSQTVTGTTAGTKTLSTTSTSATLKITCATNAAQIGYIKITPKAKFTVTFYNASGASTPDPVKQSTGGAAVTLPSTSPSMDCAADGWEFAGWKAGSYQTSDVPYLNGLIPAGSYIPGGNENLYAVFRKAGGATSTSYTCETTTGTESFSANTAAGGFTITYAKGNSSNYYAGSAPWRFYKDGSQLIVSGSNPITSLALVHSSTNYASFTSSVVGSTVTMASSSGGTTTVTDINANSITLTSGGDNRNDISSITVNYTAYTYNSNPCVGLGSISGSVTLTKTVRTMTATWSKTSGDHETGYSVQLYNNNGSGAKGSAIGDPISITGKETANRTHTFEGLTPNHQYFVGVTPTYSGDGNYCDEGTEVTGNATTNAGYTVTYAHGTGATGEMTDPNSPYDAGATVTVLSNTFEKCGAIFNVWSAEDASSNPVDVSSGSFTMPSSNVTITATWTNKQDEFLDYMHENTRSTRSGSYTTPPALSNTTPGEACEGTHYKFMGWVEADYINEDGTLKDGFTLIPGSESGHCADNKTFYAIWAEEE